MSPVSLAFISLSFLLRVIRCQNNDVALGKRYDITWLGPGDRHTVDKDLEAFTRIFCRCGDRRTLVTSLRSAYVDLQSSSSYTLFEGGNATDVVHQYKAHLSSWLPLLPWKQSQFSIPVFSNYCIGITSEAPYTISLSLRRINYWRVLQLVSGMALFLSAPSLCHNICFYYATGISVGVLASVALLVIFLSRLMPKKSAAYMVLVCGWSVVLYFVQVLWFNLRDVLLNYRSYLLAYVGISAFLSFAFCYRYKPMTDSRSQDLMQWAIQIIGLLLVYFSTEFHEVAAAFIVVFLTLHYFPAVWSARFRTLWRHRFPPRTKVQTEAEYIQQGCEETDKAIKELRSFCQSPHCQTWKVLSRLKQPLRFAKFVEGESHLTEEEIVRYNRVLISGNPFEVEVTDDSSSESEADTNHVRTPKSTRQPLYRTS